LRGALALTLARAARLGLVLKLVVPLLLALAATVLLWHGDPWAGVERAQPAPDHAVVSRLDRSGLTPATRRVANTFILSAVARRDPGAWRLIDPTFPCLSDSPRIAWEKREVMIAPIGWRFERRDIELSVKEVFPHGVLLDAVIARKASFEMGLKRHRKDSWLVNYWDSRYPITALCR
jgi:hypothetical protein